MTTKTCKRCERKLSKPRQGKKYCGPCEKAVRREARDKAHRARVAQLYGLLPGDYEALYEAQGRVCAICGRAKGVTRRLAVDHDHAVGNGVRESVRGLTCGKCNSMLAHARDDPEMFRRAIDYLDSPPAREVLK